MEKTKIRPLARAKPLDRSEQKLAGVIMSWAAPSMQNFVAIGSGVSVRQIRYYAILFGVTSMFVFWGSSIRYRIHPWTVIYAKYVK